MSPIVVFFGLTLFGLSFLSQPLLFAALKHKGEIRLLFVGFFAVPLVLASLAVALGMVPVESAFLALVFDFSLAAAYIQTYPAIREEIPSFRVLRLLRENRAGLTEEEIVRQAGHEGLFRTKVDDLVNDSLVERQAGSLRLTATGDKLARAFLCYRALLGRAPGQG